MNQQQQNKIEIFHLQGSFPALLLSGAVRLLWIFLYPIQQSFPRKAVRLHNDQRRCFLPESYGIL